MKGVRLVCLLVVAGCGFGDNHDASPDGNPPPGDGPAGCGNGSLDTGEECDDGNPFSDDGCSATCHAELLLFSEYVEGTSNNKAIEIHNPQPEALDLAASQCEVRVYFNGGATPQTFALAGSLAADDVLVLCHPSSGAELLPHCDLLSDVMNWNGDDAIEVACHAATLDVIGQIGVDPGVEWTDAAMTTSTLDTTLRRACAVTSGDRDGSDPFAVTGWTGLPTDTFDDLGQPTCAP